MTKKMTMNCVFVDLGKGTGQCCSGVLEKDVKRFKCASGGQGGDTEFHQGSSLMWLDRNVHGL